MVQKFVINLKLISTWLYRRTYACIRQLCTTNQKLGGGKLNRIKILNKYLTLQLQTQLQKRNIFKLMINILGYGLIFYSIQMWQTTNWEIAHLILFPRDSKLILCINLMIDTDQRKSMIQILHLLFFLPSH